MSTPSTSTGKQLLALLPVVYRTRDNGDLAAYLDACGELLDLLRHTLDQRLADAFPDRPPDGRAIQGWLLPYVAQLLDARLVSPHLDGRREEVARAVSWRQRKGTRAAVDEIAEAVAQTEADVHEGWQRVAHTPRLGFPREPAVTPDPRRPMGVAGSHLDHTRRTVDTRLPSTWRHGHYHPRRLILYVPPPVGFADSVVDLVDVEGSHVLEDVAVRKVVIRSDGGDPAVLDARHCLFGTVEVDGLARLEYCTVLESCEAQRVLASDCIFPEETLITDTDTDTSCLRFSRVPETLTGPETTTEAPAFYATELGQPGCGVLHPATPEAVAFGAEDGGEMGAYHHRRHTLQRAAVLEKLKDFLPMGIEAALVPDPWFDKGHKK